MATELQRLPAVLLALVTGCASLGKERGHVEVSTLIEERTGRKTRWERGSPEDEQIAAWVEEMLKADLTRERAIEIALLNNPRLQATYEELGVSQAEMVQAGLLKNPQAGIDIGLPIKQGITEVRASLVQDFLDLFVLPMRKRIAGDQFVADTLRVAHEALEVAAEVAKEYAAIEASGALVAYRRTVLDAARSAADLADRQLEAGNISDLTHAAERALYEQARLDLAREELELSEHREKFNRLLGLWGPRTTWVLPGELPELPSRDPPFEHLEAVAMRQRLDVDAARKRADLIARAVALASSSRYFGRIEVGVDAHQDPDGPRVIGMSLVLDLPLFDRRQAFVARLEAERRVAERRRAAVAIDARSEVRTATLRLATARQVAEHYRDIVLPLRTRILEQTQLHYNGMFVGLYQLVAAKREEIDAHRGYIESVRDYWMARAELERAAGGRIPGTKDKEP